MYTQLLDVAIRQRPRSDANITTGDALSTLRDCRQHLGPITSPERGTDWSSIALAHQVAYDLALIDLARGVGLDCDPSSFDPPQRRRSEIERELTSRGIHLDEQDHETNATLEHR